MADAKNTLFYVGWQRHVDAAVECYDYVGGDHKGYFSEVIASRTMESALEKLEAMSSDKIRSIAAFFLEGSIDSAVPDESRYPVDREGKRRSASEVIAGIRAANKRLRNPVHIPDDFMEHAEEPDLTSHVKASEVAKKIREICGAKGLFGDDVPPILSNTHGCPEHVDRALSEPTDDADSWPHFNHYLAEGVRAAAQRVMDERVKKATQIRTL